MFEKEVYIERRRVLKEKLMKGIVIINGNEEAPRSYKDECYPFVQDSTFRYYFGMDVPNLIGIIDIDRDKEYIFGTDFTLDDIVWSGEQKLLKTFANEVGVNNFVEMKDFDNFIKNCKERRGRFHILPQYRGDNKLRVCKALEISPFEYDEYISYDFVKAVIEQRNTKSQKEIEQIENAVNITREMQLTAMKTVKAGMKEYEVVAVLESIAKKYYGDLSLSLIHI